MKRLRLGVEAEDGCRGMWNVSVHYCIQYTHTLHIYSSPFCAQRRVLSFLFLVSRANVISNNNYFYNDTYIYLGKAYINVGRISKHWLTVPNYHLLIPQEKKIVVCKNRCSQRIGLLAISSRPFF